MRSINPATGEQIAEYPELKERDLETKLNLAASSFASYRRTTFAQRAEWMRRAAMLLRMRKTSYAETMTREMGKTISAAESEVEKCAWVCEFYADQAEFFLSDQTIDTDAGRSFVAFQPLGVVLAVMPWNFPFWQVFRFAAPALMAGNVALLKHASNVPMSALAIEEVFRHAGFPDEAFQTLLVKSPAVEKIISDPRIAAVTLTGSEGAGRSVGGAAGRNLKKVVLELGGSDPFIIMPSADIEAAVKTAVTARTMNNGQSCIAAKRFIVHAEVFDRVEKQFADGMAALRVGDPMDRTVDIGPLARPEFVEELHKQVVASVAGGARLVAGGKKIEGRGYFYAPTVLSGVRPGMAAFDEETFGPVAALIRAADIGEAIALANNSRFGLGASAWTADEGEQERFIRELEAGSVFINDMVKSDPRLPFGGIKASGMGRELGEFGIREFVNVKTVVVKW
ncbi:MAG: NAD-dependent succinate-semialdehyde dehydrogenase [Armatimonadetes bacterium]|nr:NAD-dependent succinate-semialdehyde dehydrogenase [Armatimonadota bacterium]